jgi:trehalose/maltose hydrolase-like predicted phosphorylase
MEGHVSEDLAMASYIYLSRHQDTCWVAKYAGER